MKGLKMIACVDRGWGIGKFGGLLYHIPEDMRRFRELTMGHPVIMGRSTWESLPKRPLDGRKNIVVSGKQAAWTNFDGAFVVPDLGSALAEAEQYTSSGTTVWVIGGALIYRQMLEFCDEAYITYVHARAKHDLSICSLDEAEDFELTSESEPHTHDGLTYTFRTYRNLAPLSADFRPDPIDTEN